MLRGLTKLVAYNKAPKKTFALLHPIKALKWGAAFYVGKKVWNKFSGDNATQTGSRQTGSTQTGSTRTGSTRPRHAGADVAR